MKPLKALVIVRLYELAVLQITWFYCLIGKKFPFTKISKIELFYTVYT